MKIEKRELTNRNVVKYLGGYNIVSNLMGTSKFNRDLGYVLEELDSIVDIYNKSLESINSSLREEFCEKHKLKEFPYIGIQEDFTSLSRDKRKIVDEYEKVIKERCESLLEENVGEVSLLILSEKDIEDQIEAGKKYNDQGFNATPNFYRQLRDIIE